MQLELPIQNANIENMVDLELHLKDCSSSV